jgi:DNA polymerase elongation subunit (family B)
MKVFIYQWFGNDEVLDEDETVQYMIKGYGVLENGENVCLHVNNFCPWISVELSSSKKILEKNSRSKKMNLLNTVKDIYKGAINKKVDTDYKSKLYFYQNEKKFEIYKFYFPTMESRKRCYYALKNKPFFHNGVRYKILPHEYEASPILQFLCSKNLPSCGWVEVNNSQKVHYRYTKKCQEFRTDVSNIEWIKEKEDIPKFKYMSFDLEVYSHTETTMPNADNDKDVIFQIGVSVGEDKNPKNILLTLMSDKNECCWNKIENVLLYKTEKELLQGFCDLILKEDPHILMGYNIFGFDIPYLVKRCDRYNIPVRKIGKPKLKEAEYKELSWSSSAYAYQEFHYLDLEGVIFVDLLPIIKRDYKFNNYKLKTVSTYFLGETKDPLTPKDIFEAYRMDIKDEGKGKQILRCGKYCIQDAKLVALLFIKLQTWIGLLEMAKICNVDIMKLFVSGQQIKVFSQIFRKCYKENRLVDSFSSVTIPKDIVFDTDDYCGAFVFPPVPGKYEWVVPFDFTSLYPTCIIAYNIDYSTLVYDDKIPDEDCHVISWEEGGTVYKYRFMKEPIGVIPSLLKSLLEQRNETKKLLKKTQDATAKIVLDKRQLAYKVSANSMYGGMGVKKGYLPFLPGAMCTTAKGRESIQRAAQYVKDAHKGKIIYGDSVTENTILYIKSKNEVFFHSIKSLFEQYENIPYPQFKPDDLSLKEKEQCIINNDLQIQSRSGWTKIEKIIRHKTLKKIYKIITSSGIVEVTADHSLLLNTNQCIKPTELEANKHCLMTCNMEQNLIYKKERWEGLWYQKNEYIFFHDSLDDKYISYIYFTYKKKYPNLVFELKDGELIINLFNKNNIPKGFVYSIELLYKRVNYVYDIETTDGSFHCGIGEIIVKNTDSIYCHFPQYTDSNLVWSKAKSTETEFLKLFPKPMKLLFEEKIYRDFLILTKKRYMAYTCDENGNVDNEITIRGVLLARRDNCFWIRNLYEIIVRLIMENNSFQTILNKYNEAVLDLFQWKVTDINYFIVSKLLNVSYKIKELPVDISKFNKRLKDLDITIPEYITKEEIEYSNKQIVSQSQSKKKEDWLQKYIEKSLPAHAQLANKMKIRGNPVTPGSRIEFVILKDFNNPDAKLFDKVEDPDNFIQHCNIKRLDRHYYMKSSLIPIDQIINIVFKKENVGKKLYSYHINYRKVIEEINSKNKTNIIIIN